jgi:hypothetical protein
MTDSQRQARARARRSQAGLVRLEMWVPADRRDEIRAALTQWLTEGEGAAPLLPADQADRRRARLRQLLENALG